MIASIKASLIDDTQAARIEHEQLSSLAQLKQRSLIAGSSVASSPRISAGGSPEAVGPGVGVAGAVADVGDKSSAVSSGAVVEDSLKSTSLEASLAPDGPSALSKIASLASVPSLTPALSYGTTEPPSPMCGSYIRSLGGESAVSGHWGQAGELPG